MIISYEEFEKILNDKVYKNSKVNLLDNILNNSYRFNSNYQPLAIKNKVSANIFQSIGIKFGDFIEDIVTIYLAKSSYQNLDKKVSYENEGKNKSLAFDQLFSNNNTIYMIEQKMRDDHDSSKKSGQFNNFRTKIEYIQKTYPTYNIEAIMWFVDPSIKKNKSYYTEEMKKIRIEKNIPTNLFYGKELFQYLNKENIWNELNNHLTKWHSTLKPIKEINLEEDWENDKQLFITEIKKNPWKKYLNSENKQEIELILNTVFPQKKYLEILEYFKLQ